VKRAYVLLVRSLRAVLRKTGLLSALDGWARRSPTGRWIRSWFAIYDLEDLRRLDLPWWTLDAAEKVSGFLEERPGARIFEWGSGASTIWLARRAASVHSVEHDVAWAQSMARDLPPNATVTPVPASHPQTDGAVRVASHKAGFAGLDFTEYVEAIDRVDGAFDLIVIDGRARESCLPKAVHRLAPGGLIVFDNVERSRYRHAIALLGDSVAVDSRWGRTTCLPYPTRTALLRMRGPSQ
jgi:hypothetical protein